MMLFLLAAVLTLGVVVVLVRPLLQDLQGPPSADRYNAAVYRDQLEELRREEARQQAAGQAVAGETAPGETAGARLEIERRLLAALRQGSPAEGVERRAPVMAAIVLAGGLALGAGAIYLAIGDPAAPDRPLKRAPPPIASAGSAPGSPEDMAAGPGGMHAQMDTMVASLMRKLAAQPQDPDGWTLLARSLMRLDRPAEAVSAYRRALAVTPKANAQLDAEYAEARVIAAGGTVDAEALGLFQRLLAADPDNPQARYYMALTKVQVGDVAGGLADWRALEAASPKDAPWLDTLHRRIADAQAQLQSAQAAPATAPGTAGPTRADVAAAASLSDSDRETMIQGMVDGLAARLKRNPDDLDGWRQLARADQVLGRRAQGAEASRQIQRLQRLEH